MRRRGPTNLVPSRFVASAACRVALRELVLVAVAWLALTGSASAHAFTAALLVSGEDPEGQLAEAVRGFLLAADESDGHANETSDGHLGGVDVHVLPLPAEAAGRVEGLIGSPQEPADVVIVFGPDPAASEAARGVPTVSTVLVQPMLPATWIGNDETESFVMRYRLLYGAEPGVMATTAYLAARRLDAAIRPLDGVSPPGALREAWTATDAWLPW